MTQVAPDGRKLLRLEVRNRGIVLVQAGDHHTDWVGADRLRDRGPFKLVGESSQRHDGGERLSRVVGSRQATVGSPFHHVVNCG